MRRLSKVLLITACLLPGRFNLSGQVDKEPPVAPVLDLVTINQLTDNVEISWARSPSPDVSGYVVYLFRNNEGYALDTLRRPDITGYQRPATGASYFSESYVVAALDSSGNVSPLSNQLNTIYALSKIDTCNKTITVSWNPYPSFPATVQSYSVLYSAGGSGFSEAGMVASGKTEFVLTDFEADIQYCFIVKANLAGGSYSGSNEPCLLTTMQRAPAWINADYATVVHGKGIMVSFSIDPGSEIRSFSLERKTGNMGTFSEIYRSTEVSGSLIYNDLSADTGKINEYRLTAINNCNKEALISNIASNIVLKAEQIEGDIFLRWNPYREWKGGVSRYTLYTATGGSLKERAIISPGDTAFTIHYSDIMYEVTGSRVCFNVKAEESGNNNGITGESSSGYACIPVIEQINVPNTFTPDNNGINDLFGPVLSFTPVRYQLIITDLQRKTLFESSDFTSRWDGTSYGDPLPEGVYLWFLKVTAPSGRQITRTGSVTIMFNR